MRRRPVDIYARIRAALPLARTVIATRGIDPFGNAELGEEMLAASGGDHCPPAGSSDEAQDAACKVHDGIFILGMAVGLLLDRSVLEPLAATRRPRPRRRAVTRPARSRRLTDAATPGGVS